METQRINIAIAGRTNVGKTTLISSLMKNFVGKICDAPNVTSRGEEHYFDSLQTVFIDTPGFQKASLLSFYLNRLTEDPHFQLGQKEQDKLLYDLNAMKALENSDAIVSVASLAYVPDDSFDDEISIVKRQCSKIVVVISQYHQRLKATSKPEVENRIEQWKEFCAVHSINQVVVFDAHWDNPAKINLIYDGIYDILEPEQQSKFFEGLRNFKERQLAIKRGACDMFASLIKDCPEKAVATISKADYKNEQKREEATDQLAMKINDAVTQFVYCVSELYRVSAEHPRMSKEDLFLLTQPKTNFFNRIGWGAGGAAVLGGAAAVIGGVLGATFMALASGGALPLVIAAATAWAQIGGIAGGGAGTLFSFIDNEDTVTIKIDEKQMKALAVKCIAIIWGLSNNGYGRGRDLSSEEIAEIVPNVSATQDLCSEIIFTKSTKTEILEYCEKILTLLEKKYV